QHRLSNVGGEPLLQRHQAQPDPDAGRNLDGSQEILADGPELTVGIAPWGVGPQPRNDAVVLTAAFSACRRAERRPDIDARTGSKRGGHDADDRVRLAA